MSLFTNHLLTLNPPLKRINPQPPHNRPPNSTQQHHHPPIPFLPVMSMILTLLLLSNITLTMPPHLSGNQSAYHRAKHTCAEACGGGGEG